MTRLFGLAGLCAVGVLAVGFALDMAIIVTTGGPPQIFASTIASDLSRAATSVVWRAELWTYILAVAPFAVFCLGLAARGERSPRAALIGTAAGIAFIALHTLHNMSYAAVVNGLAPAYVAVGAQTAALEQVARGFVAFAEVAFLPGGGLGGVMQVAMLVAIGTAQRGATSRLAFVSAALLSIGYLSIVAPTLPVLAPALLGWILFLMWTALTSRELLRVTAEAPARVRQPVVA